MELLPVVQVPLLGLLVITFGAGWGMGYWYEHRDDERQTTVSIRARVRAEQAESVAE